MPTALRSAARPRNITPVMDQLFPHGWLHYLAGGLLIGAGVGLLFVGTGLIGGASTLFTAVCSFFSRRPFFQQQRFVGSRAWRLVYALGMVLGALLVTVSGVATPVTAVPWSVLLLGGFIAGFGARLGNGCTSGHGICGLASLQLPSLLAVLTFLATAILTANVVRACGGPQ
ncbi:MAG TPA: YeeE/YedE thiosulfate transporter family protein [Planctomycetota bacterium]|nr:YeeE/YedE thiosulfate transporter family protein [Planctomycetota bacterium]